MDSLVPRGTFAATVGLQHGSRDLRHIRNEVFIVTNGAQVTVGAGLDLSPYRCRRDPVIFGASVFKRSWRVCQRCHLTGRAPRVVRAQTQNESHRLEFQRAATQEPEIIPDRQA